MARVQVDRNLAKRIAAIEDGDTLQFDQPLAPATVKALQRALSAKPNITLRLYNSRLTQLSVLASFPKLRNLIIQCRALRSFDKVGELVDLEDLDLGETKSKTPAVGFISKLVKLRVLRIVGHGKGIENVLELPALETLSLRAIKLDHIEPRHLEHLRELGLSWCPGAIAHAAIGAPHLRHLYLGALRDATATDLAPLANLTELESLTLDSFPKLASLDFIAGSPIRELKIENATGLRSLSGLAGAANLERLSLRNVPNLRSLADLASCGKLHTLHMSSARPQDQSLMPLLACPRLVEISAGDAYPKPAVATFLSGWKGKLLWIRGKYLRGAREDSTDLAS